METSVYWKLNEKVKWYASLGTEQNEGYSNETFFNSISLLNVQLGVTNHNPGFQTCKKK